MRRVMVPKSNEEVSGDLDRLIEHYGITDDNLQRLTSKVLYLVLCDGLVRRLEPRSYEPCP
jgi:hypothetical protein